MIHFQENLKEIEARISAAALNSGRSASDVQLLAVTKYADANVTRELVMAGCHVLGESRPQALWQKAESLKDLDIEWHLIGHLQRNKIKRSLPITTLIHSVDSLRLLDAIHQLANDLDLATNVLLEINVSGEEAKHGFSPSELESVLEHAATLPAIRVHGLMCMAGLSGGHDEARTEFRMLRELKEKHERFRTDNIRLDELSMGMSGDFEIAIEEGATIVRVGSLLMK